MSDTSKSQLPADQVLARLIDSEEQGSAAALPNVDTVVAIAEDIRSLLFPQVYRGSANRSNRRMLRRKSLLNRIHSRLTEQVEVAFDHAGSAVPRLHDETASESDHKADRIAATFIGCLPEIRNDIMLDVQAAFDGDPAARTLDEILLCYPGIEAVMVYRFAHQLQRLKVPYLPRVLTEWAHRETGIDIHPGAQIGPRFFIDHGTGVVIGETTVIGSGVTLYQGVTLGAWSFPRDESGGLIRGSKRHPTLEDDVTVYSNASILGGDTIVGESAQVGSGVTLSRSIPPGTIVTVERPSLRFREAA